jgi:hypothetical protein
MNRRQFLKKLALLVGLVALDSTKLIEDRRGDTSLYFSNLSALEGKQLTFSCWLRDGSNLDSSWERFEQAVKVRNGVAKVELPGKMSYVLLSQMNLVTVCGADTVRKRGYIIC